MGYRIPSGDDIERRLPRAQGNVQRVSADLSAGNALEVVGQKVSQWAEKKQDEFDRLDIARAKSYYLTERIKAERELDDEPDYTKWGEKYQSRLTEIEKSAQGMIRSGRQQEAFKIEIAADKARAIDGVFGKQKGKWKEAQLADLMKMGDDNATAINDLIAKGDEKGIHALLTAQADAYDAAANRGVIGADDAMKAKLAYRERYANLRAGWDLLNNPEAIVGYGGGAASGSGEYGNNIGNLISTKTNWQGKGAAGGPGGKFETFATPEAGVAANFQNFRALAGRTQGQPTLEKIAAQWAPADDGKTPLLKGNDPKAWAAAVGKYAGIDPNATLDLSNPDQMAAVMRGINRHEHGKQTVPNEAYAVGVKSVLENRTAGVGQSSGNQPATSFEKNTPGMVEPGNIDIMNRPAVKNADGSVSSVRSMSVNIDGREVLIPTVSEDGRILSDEEAVAQYEKTGKHLGKFDTPANATSYAERLHNQQASLTEGRGGAQQRPAYWTALSPEQQLRYQASAAAAVQKKLEIERVEQEKRAVQDTTQAIYDRFGTDEAGAAAYIRSTFAGENENKLISAYRDRAEEARRIDRQGKDDRTKKAIEMVWAGQEIPAAMQADLMRDGSWEAVGKEMQAQASGVQRGTDYRWMYENYWSLSPGERMKVPLATIKGHAGREDYQKILDAREKLEKDDTSLQTMAQYVNQKFKGLNLKDERESDRLKMDAFHREFSQRRAAWQQKNGTVMPDVDQRKLVDELTGKIVINPPGPFNEIEFSPYELSMPDSSAAKSLSRRSGIPVEQIPSVVRAMNARGLPITIQNLQDAWRDGTQ